MWELGDCCKLFFVYSAWFERLQWGCVNVDLKRKRSCNKVYRCIVNCYHCKLQASTSQRYIVWYHFSMTPQGIPSISRLSLALRLCSSCLSLALRLCNWVLR
ncbi:hypothetical protein FKM82_006642 [Ascaphus truei]